MKAIKTVLVLATVLSNISLAYAQSSVAVISSSAGKVLVNKGKGFAPVDGLVSLNVGDAVMIGKSSSAIISYNTGCTVNAAASSIVTVAAKAPCAEGQAMMASDAMFVTPAADFDPVIVPFPFLPLLLATGAAAGVGYLVLTKKNNSCGISACAQPLRG
jgi:hypothetical protein